MVAAQAQSSHPHVATGEFHNRRRPDVPQDYGNKYKPNAVSGNDAPKLNNYQKYGPSFTQIPWVDQMVDWWNVDSPPTGEYTSDRYFDRGDL